MSTLRTKAMNKRYADFLKIMPKNYCPFCEKDLLIKEYKYWYLLENKFPYDKVTLKHWLLTPKEHLGDANDLKTKHLIELEDIREELRGFYECELINPRKYRSILNHFHIHLVVWRP